MAHWRRPSTKRHRGFELWGNTNVLAKIDLCPVQQGELSGLRVGDMIEKVNGVKTKTASDVHTALYKASGQKVELESASWRAVGQPGGFGFLDVDTKGNRDLRQAEFIREFISTKPKQGSHLVFEHATGTVKMVDVSTFYCVCTFPRAEALKDEEKAKKAKKDVVRRVQSDTHGNRYNSPSQRNRRSSRQNYKRRGNQQPTRTG